MYYKTNKQIRICMFLFFFLSNCLSIESIPNWHKEKACVLYSGVRCCNCNISGGHAATGSAFAVSIVRLISLPFDFIIDSLLLPISVPFQGGKSIYYWNYNRNKIKEYDIQFPLHAAIAENKVKNLNKLISNQVNLESHDSFGVTPLILAIWKNDTEAIKILLENGADPNNPSKKAIYNPEKWFKSIVERMNVKNRNGYYTSPNLGSNFSPLLWATVYSTIDTLKLLKKKGAIQEDSYKIFYTIANHDSYSGVYNMVEFYLNEGLKPDVYAMYELYRRVGISIMELFLNSKSKSNDFRYPSKEELNSLTKIAEAKEDLELLLYLKSKGLKSNNSILK